MLGKLREAWDRLWEWLKPEDRHKRLAVVLAGASLAGFVIVNTVSGAWNLFHGAEKSAAGTTINAPSSSGGINGPVSSGAVNITNQSAGLDIATVALAFAFAAFCILIVLWWTRRGGATSARQAPVAAELNTQPPSVTIYNGPSPEQQAAERAAQEATSAKLDRLLALAEAGGANERAAAAGIPEAVVRAIVARLGGEDINDGELLPWLNGWIETARHELATRPGHEDEALEAARNEAERRFRAGDLDRASAAFMEEFTREEQHEAARQEERKRHRLRLLEEAVRFDELALNGEAAAMKLRLMAGIQGADEPNAVGNWLLCKAQEFYNRGDRRGDNAALLVAIATYRQALSDYTRDRFPLQWAIVHNNLGNTLWTLGERESGTQRLMEAVDSYRNALLERTRARLPLDWAATQNNLGLVLQTLGERENGTQKLTEAVDAYRNALLEVTRDRVPLYWATIQNNLGLVLQTLGERESETQRLTEAVEACRNALRERTRERVPLDWAATQNNLGLALQTIGERESGTQRLMEAVHAYRSALLEYTRDRVPLDWARTQYNLSLTFRALAEKQSDPASARQAVDALEAALAVFTGANATYYVDLATQNLARARDLLARLEATP